MSNIYFCETAPRTVLFVAEDDFESYKKTLSASAQKEMDFCAFKGKAGTLYPLLEQDAFIFCTPAQSAQQDPFFAGKLAALLPQGDYALRNALKTNALGDEFLASFAFISAQYSYKAFKERGAFKRLQLANPAHHAPLNAQLDAVFMGRDLINRPANDLGPQELCEAARTLATQHGATYHEWVGEELLEQNFPLVYHVGKASTRAPRLCDLHWGQAHHRKITLVGKGVIYDTGGLNVKPGESMFLMKKDMGGAATALSLAAMIMTLRLPVRLRVILPCVENAIAGNAFRAGDIYPSRKGLSVEIGNTDAEGRLILCDALALADEENPDLLIDFATLTGAARTALGPDLPATYAKDPALARALEASAMRVNDPLWAMPLWLGYDSYVDAKFSDLTSTPSLPFAGSITAALYLNRFVTRTKNHLHIDLYAWVPSAKNGVPHGGEVQSARACLAYIQTLLTA